MMSQNEVRILKIITEIYKATIMIQTHYTGADFKFTVYNFKNEQY